MVNIKELKRKVCLIGDWGVGKTSLIRKFVLDQFDDKYLSTFGSKVYKKRLIYNHDENNNIDLELMIWDVMGQPQFKNMRIKAYNGSQGVLIVCDVTREETLYHIAYWQSELFSITKEIPFIILINKMDLQANGKITTEDIEEISKQYNAEWLYTSAKTGENVERAFRMLGNKLISSNS